MQATHCDICGKLVTKVVRRMPTTLPSGHKVLVSVIVEQQNNEDDRLEPVRLDTCVDCTHIAGYHAGIN